MAHGKQLTWGELRVGLFVLIGVVIVALAIFYVTGTGALSAKYRLVTFLPEVDGLTEGAPVTLDGVQAGNVDRIRMAPHRAGQPPDLTRAVEVTIRIDSSFRDYIRTDSTASLLTEGFLGNREVTVKRGYTGRVLQDGEQIKGTEEKALQQVVARSSDLMDNLTTLTSQISSVVTNLQAGHGTIGKLMVDDAFYNHLNNTMKHLDDVSSSVAAGQGTLGKLVASDALYTKVDSAATHLNNVMAAIDQQQGTLGKLVYDPSFHDNAKQLLQNTNALIADMRAGKGTLGKLATDESLFNTWKETGTNFSQAAAKLNANTNSAGKLFTDPQLYDNVTGLTADMRKLVSDFRSNPKKFLHIKLSLF